MRLPNPAEAAERLYDPGQTGILVMPNALERERCAGIVKEARKARSSFMDATRSWSAGRQELDQLYLGSADPARQRINLESVDEVVEAFTEYVTDIGQHADFTPYINSVVIHRYAKGSAGISKHRDYASDINIIGVFVLTGQAPFVEYQSLHDTNPVSHEAAAGTLILMRMARNEKEQNLRPYHSVGPVRRERYSLICRERNTK